MDTVLVSLESTSMASIRVEASSWLGDSGDVVDGSGNTFRRQISVADALESLVFIQCIGVTHHSNRTPSRSFFFPFSFNLNKISVCKDATENDGLLIQSRSTSMRVFVIECSPGGGALRSNPQAAIVSITAYCDVVAELAAAHVSSRMRTSDFAAPKSPCIADQSTKGELESCPKTHSA